MGKARHLDVVQRHARRARRDHRAVRVRRTLGGDRHRRSIAGFLVCYSVWFFDHVAKVDDPCGAISVHGVCGAVGRARGRALRRRHLRRRAGTACRGNVKGLFYGDGGQLVAQMIDVGRRLHLGLGRHLAHLHRRQAVHEAAGRRRSRDRRARRSRVRPVLLPGLRHPRRDRSRRHVTTRSMASGSATRRSTQS